MGCQKSRGIIVGLKKKFTEEEVEFLDEKKKVQSSMLDPNGLDNGLPCETLKDDELLKRYIDNEKELNDLKDQFEKMRLEFEEYKLNNSKKEKKVKK